MKHVLAICLFAVFTALAGCGNPEGASVVESADQAAIDEYERLTAEQDAATAIAPPDASDE